MFSWKGDFSIVGSWPHHQANLAYSVSHQANGLTVHFQLVLQTHWHQRHLSLGQQWIPLRNSMGPSTGIYISRGHQGTYRGKKPSGLHRHARTKLSAPFTAGIETKAPKLRDVITGFFFFFSFSFLVASCCPSSTGSSITKTSGFTDLKFPSPSRSWWLSSIFTSGGSTHVSVKVKSQIPLNRLKMA